MVERSLPQNLVRMQSAAEGEQVGQAVPGLPRDLRRTASALPNLVPQSQHALNEVLAHDDLRDQERIEAQILSQEQNEQDAISGQAESLL